MKYLHSATSKYQHQIRFNSLLKNDEKSLEKQLNILDAERKKNKHNPDFDINQNLAQVKNVICTRIITKVNEFIKVKLHNRELLIEEYLVLLLSCTENWNSKTKKQYRKITIADFAQMAECCSSSVTKVIAIFKKAGAEFNEYRFLKVLFDKFLKAEIKTRMFKWLLDWVIKNEEKSAKSSQEDDEKCWFDES